MIIDRDRICWLLVGDGATARFFALQTRPLHLESIPMPPLHNHASERHGSVPQDRKDRFTAKVAAVIAAAAAKKQFQDLVVAAPAPMLGELRKDLEPAVAKMVTFEIVGEWANLSTPEIAAHLKPYLLTAG